MANGYSMEDLLDFLSHASERGLMPAATAQALAVATRNVLGVLGEEERADLRKTTDLAGVIKRFNNKRAKEFSPSSLKEYGRRARRAVDLFLQWREDPANFTVKTRATTAARSKERNSRPEPVPGATSEEGYAPLATLQQGGYQSAFPIRPGRVVSIVNVPDDLTPAEAERLASFVRMLAVE